MKDEKLWYFWGSLKNPSFRGGFTKKQYIGGDCLKRGLGQFADLRGAWQERGGWYFWGGRDTPMHTMDCPLTIYWFQLPPLLNLFKKISPIYLGRRGKGGEAMKLCCIALFKHLNVNIICYFVAPQPTLGQTVEGADSVPQC